MTERQAFAALQAESVRLVALPEPCRTVLIALLSPATLAQPVPMLPSNPRGVRHSETLPTGSPFPYRNSILLCASAVVLVAVVLQGLTMALLIRRTGLTDDDPVGREIRLGRVEVYNALLDAIKDHATLFGKLLRKECGAVIEMNESPLHPVPIDAMPEDPLRRGAIEAVRQFAFELRRDDVIGVDAHRALVHELGRVEFLRNRVGSNVVDICRDQ